MRPLLLILWLATVGNALAQPTLTIGVNTRVVGTGDAQFEYGGGSLTNNGSLSLAAGQLSANGPTTYGGSGAAIIANISFGHSTGTSTLNSLLSVTNRATLSANTALNANGQLYLRTDQFPNADLVNNGILTGTVQGLVTRGTVLTGNTPYSSLLSTNVSGTSASYQWQSSADNTTWADVAGATSPTYTANVSATTYYRCRLTTSNSTYNQNTPALLLNVTGAPPQPIRYVTQNGTGDGSSWASASSDLQAMIDALGVEQVWVAGGTFKPSVTGLSNARLASFVMKNNVAIYGGFFGTEANLTDRPAVNPILGTPSSTTLSGDIGTPGNNSDNSYHVFYNIDNGLTSTAILDGVVITGGNASGGSNIATSNAGGGMYIRRSSPTLINCVLANNSAASGGGGGIYINSGNNTTLTNCLLVNNSAQRGGGIFNFSSITLTNCKLINNSATFADGGGLNGGAPTLINCSLINNSAIGNGGGVYGLSPVLVNCSLQANSATNGGGIYNNGSPTLTNCSLLSNSATTGGGIYNNGTPTLANCVLWDNGAGNTIVNNSPATLTATYSLFDNTVTGYTGSNNKTTNTSPFASANDVTLAPNSPAIDAGSNAAYEKGPATDLAGNPRIFPTGGTIDMGAYEYQGSPVQPVAITSQPPSASSVTTGASVSAPASVMGSVSGYQWYKDNLSNAVAGQTSATLTLTNVQLADAGSYSLVVTGTYNSVTSTAFNLSVSPAATGVPSLSSPANSTTTNGLPTFAGSAPGGSTVMVYLSGTASQTLTTTANGGQFSVTPGSPLSSGSYSAYAVAISSGQTTSPASNTNAFSVDATAPAVTLSASVGNGATTSSQPTSFTAQFSEPVTGFDVSKVSVSNGSVNGFSGSGASYSFSVTASTPGQPTNVSIPANVAQDGVGNSNTASDSYGFTLIPGEFAIRSVDTRQCQLVDASRGEYRVSFTPIYSGLNGTPVSLRVINEVDATTAPGPYTIRLYSDNPTVALLAQQAASPDARFSYAWLAACQGSVAPNRPPTTTGIPAQQLVQNQPYQLELTRYFADPDGQTLTYSSSALPAGLTLAGTTISGSPTAPGRTTVRITALDPGGLSVATDVAMQVDATPATTPPAGFTITGVTDLTCVAVTVTERRVSFSPVYSGLDGSSVRFRAVNEQDFGTTPGPYSLRLYTDNPAVTLEAIQTGQTATYRYNWLSACGNQTPPTVTNRPPVVVVPIAPQSATVGQGYSFYVPANTFADPEGEPLSLRTGGLPAGLSFSASLSAITGTPTQAGTSTIELTASDPAGQSVSLNFTLQVVAGATPPPPPAGFTITGVGSVTCLSVSNTERRLSFFPQYTGVDGSPIRFRVVNEQDFGTTPGPYSLRLYTDNPAVTLEAVQTGQTATYRYNWLAACTSPANSRQAVAEASSPLSVVVLGNPVVGESVEVLIGGVAGQAVELNLTDLAGDRLHQQQIPQASGSARVVVPVPAGQAMTILKVSTATQQQTVKLIRH
ncbi:putative Ig domain-containing protein [Spirosoma oryzae]|uniref:Putative Ig domain-containing protein n=1 Tax=Spirosoma oryzae TaxID=1469603 RepID=A0A2T0RXL5_9BACT|nr:putative Ig domain-containing protein [Spirosoma oryzae]PRY25897.1 putative Ig domain-containing protein [Spirosoma oryzae]